MRVVVFRHGIAQDRAEPDGPPDAERALTPKGIRRTRRAAVGLAALDVAPDVILTSPLLRARQTAEIAARALGCDDLRESPALAIGSRVDGVFDLLAGLADRGAVLCVGHAPQLDLFLVRALGAHGAGLAPLRKAGAACVLFEDPAPGKGRLAWFLEPRALRRLGRD
jgi:phosphohistidine phosphatase